MGFRERNKFMTAMVHFLFLYLSCEGSVVNSDSPLDFLSVQNGMADILPKGSAFASPTCWVEAFYGLNQAYTESSATLGVSTCNSMTENHRRFLAFELTRCHMASSNRPISLQITNESHEMSQNVGDEHLGIFLSRLSDLEFNTYTQFFNSIHLICIQLSTELQMAQLTQSSIQAISSFKEITLTAEGVKHKLEEVSKQVEQGQVVHRLMQIESKAMMTDLRENSLVIKEAMQLSGWEVSKIHDTISSLSGLMKNFTGKAIFNFSWTTTFFFFLVSINIWYILTAINIFRRARSFALLGVCFQLLLECVAHASQVDDNSIINQHTRELLFSGSRNVLTITIFMAMFIVAARSFRHDDTIEESIDVNVVENLRSSQEYIQNEIATCLYEQKNLKMQLLSLSVSQDHLSFSSNSCASPSKSLRTQRNMQRNSCKRMPLQINSCPLKCSEKNVRGIDEFWLPQEYLARCAERKPIQDSKSYYMGRNNREEIIPHEISQFDNSSYTTCIEQCIAEDDSIKLKRELKRGKNCRKRKKNCFEEGTVASKKKKV